MCFCGGFVKRSFSQRHENSDVFLSAKTGLEQTNAVVMVQHYKSGVLGNESDCPLPVRKRPFLRCHFILKTIILPRQARDKHRENSKKDAFLGGARLALPVPNGSPASVDGAKNACTISFARVYAKSDRFVKTGSGQT
jgi:hypothetical protein